MYSSIAVITTMWLPSVRTAYCSAPARGFNFVTAVSIRSLPPHILVLVQPLIPMKNPKQTKPKKVKKTTYTVEDPYTVEDRDPYCPASEASHKELQHRVSERDLVIVSLKQGVTDLTTKLRDTLVTLKEEKDKYEADIHCWELALDEANNQLDYAQTCLKAAQDENIIQSKKRSEVEQDKNNLRVKVQELQLAFDNKCSDYGHLSTSYLKLKAAKEQLEGELSDARTQLKDLEARNAAQSITIDELKAQLADYKKANDNLGERLEELHEENEVTEMFSKENKAKIDELEAYIPGAFVVGVVAVLAVIGLIHLLS